MGTHVKIFTLNFLYLLIIAITISQNTICMQKKLSKNSIINKMLILNKAINNGSKAKNLIPEKLGPKVRRNSFLTTSKMNLLEKSKLDTNQKNTNDGNSPKSLVKRKNYNIPRLLISNLANNLDQYGDFYCSGEASPTPENSPESPPEEAIKKELSHKTEQSQQLLIKDIAENVKIEFNRNNSNRLINLNTNENLQKQKAISRKKSFRELLKKIDIEFKIHTTKDLENKNKKILGVNGTVLFSDIRNFTFFSNQCQKDELPAIFMSEYTSEAEKIFRDWNANLTSTAGDSFVVIFPKKRSEINTKESFVNAFLCSIEFVIKMSELMKSKKEEYYPKRFDLGLETGLTFFYKLKQNIVPIAVVSKTINNAQRYEAHSKQSKQRKITISEKTYNLLNSYKAIQKLFSQKSLLEAKGIDGRPFVYSCSLKNIKEFHESREWDKYKKEIITRNEDFKQENNLEAIISMF